MAKYTKEFKKQIVMLYWDGKTPSFLEKEYDEKKTKNLCLKQAV